MSEFHMEKQRRDKWCWAAVSASIDRYFFPKSSWTQCRIAHSLAVKKELPQISVKADCCGTPESCNQVASLGDALQAIGRLNKVLPRALTFQELCDEIDQNRPVGVRIGWLDGGGHFVAVNGYYLSSGNQIVHVADPLFGPSVLYYQDFANCYQFWNDGGGFWTHSYYIKATT
jgi:hypothetical protein